MGIFMDNRRKRQQEEMRDEVINCGDFLVAKATVVYAATVFKDTVDRKLNKLEIDTALSLKAPDLRDMYKEILRLAGELLNVAKECCMIENKARNDEITDEEVLSDAATELAYDTNDDSKDN